MKNTKEDEEEELTYPKEKKSTLKTLLLVNSGTRGIYQPGGAPGKGYGSTR